MNDTPNPDHRSERTKSLARIAAARASRVPVDHNGKPKGTPTTYTYDSTGRLIATDPADDTIAST